MLAAAIANREPVRMRYTTADGGEGPRHVEPHGLVTAGRRWYLVSSRAE
ncbi:WYL domain-containing protein [Pseudonocardia aurantiaca]|uniref:WYL domain-containing protein n=1 Tax=Pseudonocardia aurantiaca TaxID=75290 RepID=A0ABW4FJ88_9PSEU